VASKSAQYCLSSRKNTTGILLLNEVALGHQLKLSKANYNAKKACQRCGCDSVKGVGRHGPSELTAQYLADGVRLCMGPMASDADYTNGDLLCISFCFANPSSVWALLFHRYSEHVIYDVARCRIRFLLIVKFVYND
jgi:poly [ADP-ribose] polymerase